MKELREYISRRQRILAAVTATVGAVLANFTGPMLLKFAPLNSSVAVTQGVLKVAGNLLLASTIAFFLTLAIRIARVRGFSTKRIATIALFLIFSVALATMTYKVNAAFNDFVEYVTKKSAKNHKDLKGIMATATSLEKRSKISFIVAQEAYEDEGRIINYMDIDGTERRYRPDKEAMENRGLLLLFQSITKAQNQTSFATIIIWILSTVVAVIFGFKSKAEIETTRNTRLDHSA